MISGISKRLQVWGEDHSVAGRAAIMLILLALSVWLSLNPSAWTPFAPLDLVIHEIGHPLFSFMGEWLHYAGGTILQLAVPIFAIFAFIRQEEYFGIPFGLSWLAVNLFEVATYIAATSSPNLELVTLGFNNGEPVEVKYTDWEYLLDRIPGLSIQYDAEVAFAVRIIAFIVLWGSIAIGVWMLYAMRRRDENIEHGKDIQNQSHPTV